MELSLSWNKSFGEISAETLKRKRTSLFMANEAKRLMNPYVPAKNLALAKNVRVYNEGENGVVHYLSPYAHYQYIGRLMVSSRTGSPWAKHGESKVYAIPEKKLKQVRSRHSLATAEWDKAMLVARKEDLAHAVQEYVRKG